jgi:hypothetical protein
MKDTIKDILFLTPWFIALFFQMISMIIVLSVLKVGALSVCIIDRMKNFKNILQNG